MIFSEKDLAQFCDQGVSLSTIEEQLAYFEKGFPFLDISEPATVENGILQLSDAEASTKASAFDKALSEKDVLKFVPASGAASRMFKALFSFMSDYDGANRASFEADSKNPVNYFFKYLKDFAFYGALEASLPKGETLDALTHKGMYDKILRYVLTEDGLNYGNLPKGLLLFHQYEDGARTPLDEHLVEAAHYSKGKGGVAALHFTVSPEHEEKFKERLTAVKDIFEERYNVKYRVSFSQQKPSTDTIAVEMDNTPFREEDGSILCRPGGHGALIENLNEIDADIVFIKNIDNVVPDRIKETTYLYKKAIAGVLIETQTQIFDYLKALDEDDDQVVSLVTNIIEFLENELCVVDTHIQKDSLEKQVAYCRKKLNRPVRVCGMVKNEGEPGGGPFWAKSPDGTFSLQVVESAQIDMDNARKQEIVNNATHFNPVDLVCGLRDYKGHKFDLLQFRDPETGFISYKSKDGRELKAQELPGLWNGAMADWNTIFVEVPIITFNPVKTVNDLLRENHQ